MSSFVSVPFLTPQVYNHSVECVCMRERERGRQSAREYGNNTGNYNIQFYIGYGDNDMIRTNYYFDIKRACIELLQIVVSTIRARRREERALRTIVPHRTATKPSDTWERGHHHRRGSIITSVTWTIVELKRPSTTTNYSNSAVAQFVSTPRLTLNLYDPKWSTETSALPEIFHSNWLSYSSVYKSDRTYYVMIPAKSDLCMYFFAMHFNYGLW